MLSLAVVAQLILTNTCVVDPKMANPSAYPDVASALAGACSASNSEILIDCPKGCAIGPITITGAEDLWIHTSKSGPVTVASASDSYGILIEKSTNVKIEGLAAIYGAVGLQISDSRADILGNSGAYTPAAYTMVEASDVGLDLRGPESVVRVDHLAFTGSVLGWQVEESTLWASGIIIAGTKQAGLLTGGSTTCQGGTPGGANVWIHSSAPATLNYIRDNVAGFYLSGASGLFADHIVFSENLRQNTSPRSQLFDLQEASNLTLRNALIHDNDEWPTPPGSGQSCDPSSCPQSDNRLLTHETCGKVRIETSTVADQQTDSLFNVGANGSGELELQHSFFTRITGKTFSMSAYVAQHGCPPITAEGAVFWGNGAWTGLPKGADFYPSSPMCAPAGIDYDDLTVGTNGVPPFNLPQILPPPNDLYSLRVFEPVVPYALPPNLYDVGYWSVEPNGGDKDPLDVGFHSPQ